MLAIAPRNDILVPFFSPGIEKTFQGSHLAQPGQGPKEGAEASSARKGRKSGDGGRESLADRRVDR